MGCLHTSFFGFDGNAQRRYLAQISSLDIRVLGVCFSHLPCRGADVLNVKVATCLLAQVQERKLAIDLTGHPMGQVQSSDQCRAW